MIGVDFQNFHFGRAQGGFHCGKLLEDVDTIAIVFHHFGYSARLTFDLSHAHDFFGEFVCHDALMPNFGA